MLVTNFAEKAIFIMMIWIFRNSLKMLYIVMNAVLLYKYTVKFRRKYDG